MPKEDAPLVWFDMEMTGLDPKTCVPLQIAAIVTDAELVELDSFETTLWQPETALGTMVPFVTQMHTKNGLLKEVRACEVSLDQAEKKLLEFLSRWSKPGQGVLCGNSIHQDRRFLVEYFPGVERYLHYRMVDVSTLKELVRRWYGDKAVHVKGETAHTALADARASIAELSFYRKTVFKPSI